MYLPQQLMAARPPVARPQSSFWCALRWEGTKCTLEAGHPGIRALQRLVACALVRSRCLATPSSAHAGEQGADCRAAQDDDGAAYVAYSSEENRVMHISQLTRDFTGVQVRLPNPTLLIIIPWTNISMRLPK